MVKLVAVVICCLLFVQTAASLDGIIIPVKIEDSPVSLDIKRGLEILNAPQAKIEGLSLAISSASRATEINPLLLLALMSTESNFKVNAISPKGYKGLMQTPWASMKWEEVDVMIGAKILKEKLLYAKNDIPLALALYKGGNNPVAHKQAKETLVLYKQLQRKIRVMETKLEDGHGKFES